MSDWARKTSSVLIAVLVSAGVWAQEPVSPKWNVTLQGGPAYVPKTKAFSWRDEMMSTYVYPAGSVEIGYQTTEEDSPFAALYGFPNVGIGLGWDGLSSLHYNGLSRLDDIFNLYGFAERTLLQGKRVSLDFLFDLGAGFNRSLYDPETNPLNRNFNSYLVIFVSGGLSMHVALTDRLEAGVAAQLNHYSTGRLAYPNGGLNNPVAYLSLRYRNMKRPTGRGAVKPFQEAPERFFYEVYAGGGVHRCAREWIAFGTTEPWAQFSFGASANWRYRPHLSTGVAVDLFDAPTRFLDRLEECERKLYGDETIDAYGPYKPLSGGIGLVQHLHYGRFSAFATVGAYVYRHNGYRDQRGKLYQKVGLKYVLPGRSGLFVAADCKAHGFSRAAMMEVTVGVRLKSSLDKTAKNDEFCME